MTDLVAPTPVARRLDDETLSQLFVDARTAGSFTNEPVTDDELTEIWNLARWAPTAANFQPMRITYVQTPEGRERLVSHMAEGNKARTLAAPAVAVLAFDSRFHEHIPTVVPFRAALVPVFEADEDGRTASARFNASIQAGYFVLAVRASGLAAGPMGGFDSAAFDADFYPDKRFRSFLVVNIGHPAEDAYRDRLPRLDLDEV
ncbi:MAG: malonic semialdehyde reductase, partial [Microbacteriaceae bacterium]|nr:malonic semialdehyde reductase [Microbacteriaceae bacterium]